MRIVLLLLFSCVILFVGAQDCKVGGNKCVDHEQCCGGCCFYGECVDTYSSCQSSPDVCDDYYCRGDEECIAYRPPECPGCALTPLCINPYS